MTDIDYEALAKAAWLSRWGVAGGERHAENDWRTNISNGHAEQWESAARAVVAALRDQGLVVVRAEDLDVYFFGDDPQSRRDAFDRLNTARNAALAALAASGDGGETTDG